MKQPDRFDALAAGLRKLRTDVELGRKEALTAVIELTAKVKGLGEAEIQSDMDVLDGKFNTYDAMCKQLGRLMREHGIGGDAG